MKIYMNLYSNSRFIIDAENIELKEDNEKFSGEGANALLKIIAYDKMGKEYKLIDEKTFTGKTKIGEKRKYLLKIMDSISEDFIKGYSVPSFDGLVQKAINDVKEEDKNKK